jgi:penicillin amidase
MDKEYTRRAIAAAVLGGVTGAATLSPAESYLDRFAALSGPVWERATGRAGGTVESPYGEATVTYDEYGVPTIAAEDELAGYFAIGYTQGTDRLFQMDLFRRQLRGELSAVVGEATLESDRFHRRLNFSKAARVTWERLQGTEAEAPVRAFVEGVNAAREREALPIEFGLLEYEPDPWTPADTLLMEKQISWGLTGSFRTLRQATLADTLDSELFAELFPDRFEHDAPIIREDIAGEVWGRAPDGRGTTPAGQQAQDIATALDPEEVARLSSFESPPGIGSNSWVVGAEYTESGRPLMANDPHLTLTVPPLWYEQRHEFPTRTVHGVTFPGVPFVIIGRNQAGGWGVTNTGADVIDFYRYEVDGDTYRHGDEYRRFETREEEIAVADGPDETLTVRETVHGPMITREGQSVAVAWTGMTGTATALAVYRMAKSEGREDVLEAARDFDLPTQNLVYADRDGGTLYHATGRIPRRVVDGEAVYGDRVFDGSAREAEWEGFTPFGQSSWSGFVPFEEKPAVIDPDWIGTANQRVLDDPRHPISTRYSDPFRAIRLDERLRELTDRGDVTPADMRELQRDTLDHRARLLVPAILEAATADQQAFVDPLEDWDYHMGVSSGAALVFDAVWRAYREELYADAFSERGLEDETYWPADWVTATLPADAAWFEAIGRSRTDVLRDAIASAQSTVEEAGHVRYGDANALDLAHPFQQAFLGYPTVHLGGASATLFNVRRDAPAGSSWRMVVPPAGTAEGIVPGGNSGDYFDPHYHDQLSMWARGEYRQLREATGEPALRFRGEGDD